MMLKRHLDLALKRNAPVIDVGDFFCAMQGKYDKRSNKNDIRPEHQKGDYLDALVKTAANYLEPYAPILTMRGWGNHETAMLKNHETDLTERLVERLRSKRREQRSARWLLRLHRFHVTLRADSQGHADVPLPPRIRRRRTSHARSDPNEPDGGVPR
jgi:hypothetical protein